MSMHTRCTHCEAVFRVTLLQLQSSSGRVRCGVCREVFDAFVHLRAADPPPVEPASPPPPLPQIDLPEGATAARADVHEAPEIPMPTEAAADVDPAPEASDAPTEGSAEIGEAPAPPPPDIDGFVLEETVASATGSDPAFAAPADDSRGEADGWPTTDEEDTDGAPFHGFADTRLPAPSDTTTPALTVTAPAGRRRRWPLVAGVSAALILLAGQATYLFRTPIATALPALRPALENACAVAGCSVPLPRLPERLVIETSDLRALDPSRPNRVVLATTIRNAAPMAQAYPMLELSLTDARDKLTARKVFSPQEYLDTPPLKGAGLGPDAEFTVRMQLDIGDIEASGYRLYLFHR